ncbi:hypothetical protein OQ968_02910 [Mycobacterium sp. 663a-19]|uniref:hypothetical protein n=1 Tax=Mycobacterium sp. 663a-19 TaxID=2986148 RepID=UPI002D1EA05D|nr:hypothetical protein [Mycobacterium sp. 663a-19]MEB3980211.1 hypothetical protein [Mycobacterium sp. 663a-19]
MTAPVTPCAPQATVAFVQRQFGDKLATTLDPTIRLAVTRERRITELRRCGELRHAERYGWLTLAGWLLGMKATVIGRLNPDSAAILHRARPRDVLPDPLADDLPPALVALGDTGLQTSDPRDVLGYRVVELAASALRDGLVEIDGRRVSGAAVAASLRERLQEVGRD